MHSLNWQSDRHQCDCMPATLNNWNTPFWETLWGGLGSLRDRLVHWDWCDQNVLGTSQLQPYRWDILHLFLWHQDEGHWWHGNSAWRSSDHRSESIWSLLLTFSRSILDSESQIEELGLCALRHRRKQGLVLTKILTWLLLVILCFENSLKINYSKEITD